MHSIALDFEICEELLWFYREGQSMKVGHILRRWAQILGQEWRLIGISPGGYRRIPRNSFLPVSSTRYRAHRFRHSKYAPCPGALYGEDWPAAYRGRLVALSRFSLFP